MSADQVPYKFPMTQAEQDQWRKSVREAIGSTLVWTPSGIPGEWILSGKCPNCKHEMTQLVHFDTVTSDMFGGAQVEAPPAGDEVEVEIVCNCSESHKKDVAGCGYGKGVRCSVKRPRG